MYHNLALDRGPLRAVIARGHDDYGVQCRHGCEERESLQHFIYHCPKVNSQREKLEGILSNSNMEFTLKA